MEMSVVIEAERAMRAASGRIPNAGGARFVEYAAAVSRRRASPASATVNEIVWYFNIVKWKFCDGEEVVASKIGRVCESHD
jgi:hypothetical protein